MAQRGWVDLRSFLVVAALLVSVALSGCTTDAAPESDEGKEEAPEGTSEASSAPADSTSSAPTKSSATRSAPTKSASRTTAPVTGTPTPDLATGPLRAFDFTITALEGNRVQLDWKIGGAGEIESMYGFERGTVVNTFQSKGTGPGSYSVTLDNMPRNVEFAFQAAASRSADEGWTTSVLSILTMPATWAPPQIDGINVHSITAFGASLDYRVTNGRGLSETVTYGPTAAYGYSASPWDGTEPGQTRAVVMNQMTPNTDTHYRINLIGAGGALNPEATSGDATFRTNVFY